MRRMLFTLAGVLLGCSPATQVATAQAGGGSTTTTTTTTSAWIDGAPVRTQVVVGDDGRTHVGVWVTAPDTAPGVAERAPVALSLVVDTSGSMAGEKIAHARMAAASLLEALRPGDQISIYAFASNVVQIAGPTVVSRHSVPGLMQRIRMLQATGSTALHDGLAAGLSHVQRAPASHPVRRVVVISDGRANVGPADPDALGNLAAAGTEYGAQVTAIGVGLGYDEATLGAMAVRSSGRLYHLAEPAQMASILEEELQLLAATVATDAVLVILPAPGVEVLGVDSMGARLEDGAIRVPVGALHAGQNREVLFRARLDTANLGDRPLATARLVYRDPRRAQAEHTQVARLSYRVVRDRRAAARSVAPRVHAMVATHEASQAQLAAVQYLNSGDGAAAERALRRAQRVYDEAASVAPASPEREELRRRSQRAGSTADRARAAGAAGGAAARGAALDLNSAAMDDLGY